MSAKTLHEILQECSADLDIRLGDAVREVTGLREAMRAGGMADDLTDIHQDLLRARGYLDRTEAIVGMLTRLRARSAQAVDDCQAARDDAFAHAVEGGNRGLGEYATAQEKNAMHSLKIIQQELDLHRAKRLDRDVTAALDYCRLLYRGMDAGRRDLDTRIRLISLQGSLER